MKNVELTDDQKLFLENAFLFFRHKGGILASCSYSSTRSSPPSSSLEQTSLSYPTRSSRMLTCRDHKIELREWNIWCYFSKILYFCHRNDFFNSSKFSLPRPVGGIFV